MKLCEAPGIASYIYLVQLLANTCQVVVHYTLLRYTDFAAQITFKCLHEGRRKAHVHTDKMKIKTPIDDKVDIMSID